MKLSHGCRQNASNIKLLKSEMLDLQAVNATGSFLACQIKLRSVDGTSVIPMGRNSRRISGETSVCIPNNVVSINRQ